MNQKYLYLVLNIGSFIVPFLFSFYPKANFSKKWKYVWPAITITAIFFIVWDEIFTRMGVWGFNTNYTTGIAIFNLPLEEVLFFFCIPYACYFTYYALSYLIEKNHLRDVGDKLSLLLAVVSFIIAMLNTERWYTFVTFILLALLMAYHWRRKTAIIGKFYLAFAVILIPFFIVNGILTGTGLEEPVVWYNDAENLSIRIGTIPVEDMFYALLMILMSVSIGEALEAREKNKALASGLR